MDREPNKRHFKWFTKPRLGGLGRFWRRAPRSSRGARGGQPLPPGWDPIGPGRSDLSQRSPRAFWRRFRSSSRRQRAVLAAGAGGLALLSLIGIAVLFSHLTLASSGAPSGGSASGHTLSTAATGSPAATITTTATALPFTITFTCASGTIRRAGEVCVHTQANALLSLTVRYCDGSYAGGRGLHGSASADASGDYTWRFTVRTKCAGTATATVVAKSAGQTVTQSTTFTVTR